MSRVLLPFPAQRELAQAIAPALPARVGTLKCRRFPDGESLVAVDTELAGADVALVCSLNDPDAIALPVRFAAETARELGARTVGLVAPYLSYLRQDQRFHPGEGVTARLFSGFLQSSFDWLVTVDPHLHRIASLDDLFTIPTSNVQAAPAVAGWIRDNVPNAMVLGPDAESAQWVSEVAGRAGRPWQVLSKLRRGDELVEVAGLERAIPSGHQPVIVDDIASTGRTLLAALAQLPGDGGRQATCVVTHAVFAAQAYERLEAAGARIVSTDTIPHPSNAIPIAPLLVPAIAAHFERVKR